MANIWQTSAEEIAWEERKNVIYHFFCYKYFSNMRSRDGIDLINLTDSDVQYYNRECDNTKTPAETIGTKSSHELAHFLNNYEPEVDFDPVEKTIIYRKGLIKHVACYNSTVDIRRRLFMINITPEEIEYMSKITLNKNGRVGENSFKAHLTWATDGCVGDAGEGEGALVEEAEKDENHMAYEVVKHVQASEENDLNGNFFKIEVNVGAVKGPVLGLNLDRIFDAATEIKTPCKAISGKVNRHDEVHEPNITWF